MNDNLIIKVEENEDCAFCLEPSTTRINCCAKYPVHRECLEKWFAVSHKCIICRRELIENPANLDENPHIHYFPHQIEFLNHYYPDRLELLNLQPDEVQITYPSRWVRHTNFQENVRQILSTLQQNRRNVQMDIEMARQAELDRRQIEREERQKREEKRRKREERRAQRQMQRDRMRSRR